jgi:hypothetical protein
MRKSFWFVLLFSGILEYSAAAGAEQIELPRRGIAAHRGAGAAMRQRYVPGEYPGRLPRSNSAWGPPDGVRYQNDQR